LCAAQTAAELVALGAPLDAVDEDEQTPLHLAVMADQADTACVLLKLGADAERKNEEGQSPRELCTSKGLQAVLEAMPV
jgi:ankyrin repeat protein